ncbi:hypothetical protein FIBSPDRAFT_879262, partial [Athelia psychrophila]
DFADQAMLTLTADIKYKSNWQQGALKGQRRNKWICALKSAMKEVKVFGPKGDPGAIPDPVRQTQVPWEEVKHKAEVAARAGAKAPDVDTKMPVAGWNLADKNAVIEDVGDVFGEADQLNMTNPSNHPPPGLRQRPAALAAQASNLTMAQSFQTAEMEIEMTPRGDPTA